MTAPPLAWLVFHPLSIPNWRLVLMSHPQFAHLEIDMGKVKTFKRFPAGGAADSYAGLTPPTDSALLQMAFVKPSLDHDFAHSTS